MPDTMVLVVTEYNDGSGIVQFTFIMPESRVKVLIEHDTLEAEWSEAMIPQEAMKELEQCIHRTSSSMFIRSLVPEECDGRANDE